MLSVNRPATLLRSGVLLVALAVGSSLAPASPSYGQTDPATPPAVDPPPPVDPAPDPAPPTLIELSASPGSAGEGDDETVITVTAAFPQDSAVLTEDATVNVSVAGGGENPAGTDDYTAVDDFDITITAGETSGNATFNLNVTDDNTAEEDETLTLSGTTETTGIDTINSTAVTITDNDTAPTTIDLTASPDTAAEGEEPTEITVTASFPQDSAVLPSDTVIRISVAGSGENPAAADDYTAVDDFDITITAGETSGNATFNLNVTDDNTAEEDETLTLSGTTETTGIDTINSTAVTITDNDTAPTTIDLTASPNTLGEDDESTEITVTAAFPQDSAVLTEDITVTVSVTGGGENPAAADDYTAVDDFDITITAGETSGNATFNLNVTDDNTAEEDETLTLSGTTETTGIDTINSAAVTITDNDDRLILTVSPSAVAEGAAGTEMKVTASLPAGAAVLTEDATVSVSVAGGGENPAAADDFTAVDDFDITITAGETSGNATFTLTATDDNTAEGNETLLVSGTTEAPDFTGVDSAAVTITDNDAAPSEITLTTSPNTAGEGDKPTKITVIAAFPEDSAVLLSDTVVEISVAGGGDNPASTDDYTAVDDFDITITAGERTGEGTFTLVLVEDLDEENPETLTVSGDAEGFTVAAAVITITDERSATEMDPPTSIDLSVSPSVVGESGAPVRITVTASFPAGADTLASDAAVTVSVAAGTAEAADFTPVSDFTITISNGQTFGTAAFDLTVAADGADEEPDTITVSGATTAAGITQVNGASITITDSGIAPLDDTLCSNGTYVADPATNTGLVSDCQALVAIRNHWTNDADNAGLPSTLHLRTWSGVITTWSGVTVGAQRVTGVALAGGATGRIAGALPAQLASLTALTQLDLSQNRLTGTIPAQLASLTALTQLDLSQNRLTGTIPAQLASLTALTELDLSYNRLTGSIPAELDRLAPPAQGQGALTAFRVCKNNLSGALSTPLRSVTTLDITNQDRVEDCRRSIDLSVRPAGVSEDSGTAAMTVTVDLYGYDDFDDQDKQRDSMVVTVSVEGGTAAGTDFTAVPDLTFTIPKGRAALSKKFDLTVTDDSVQEGDETLTVSGVDAAGYPVNGTEITILANDSAPAAIDLSVSPSGVGETGAAVEITVTAAFPAGSTPQSTATDVTITVGQAGDTAASADGSGQDYSTDKIDNRFTVTIAAGDARGSNTFNLTVNEDGVDEGAESITISGAATLAGVTSVNSTAITITDSGIAPLDPAHCSDGTFVPSPTLNAGLVSECRTLAAIRNHWTNHADNADLHPGHRLRTWSGSITGWQGVEITGQSITSLVLIPLFPVSQDRLEGAIPGQIGDLSGLKNLYLNGNSLTGAIPGELGSLTNLERLLLHDNDLSGSIPPELGNSTKLKWLFLDDNALTGAIPTQISGLTSLEYLSITDNRISGAIPTQIGGLSNLKGLYLDNNWLTGSIPTELGNLSNLIVLYINGNQLTDSIPTQLGSLSPPLNRTLLFSFCGNNLSGALPVSLRSARVILDFKGDLDSIEDCRRSINMLVNPASVAEDSGRTDIAVIAELEGGSTWHEDLTVAVSVADGTAAAGSDFTAVGSFNVTIPAGQPQSGGADTFELAVTDDAQAETAETVTVSGTGSVAWIRMNPTAVTIETNDSAPASIDLSVDPSSVNEGSGQTRITVSATFPAGAAALATDTVVKVSVKSSIAVSGEDFAAVQPFDMTISAGQTSAQAGFDLTVTDDSDAEGSERLTVAGAADGFTVKAAHLTVVDNDTGAAPIQLSVSPASVDEGAGSPEITVTAAFPQGTTPPASQTVVEISVAGGTAAAGQDFTAVDSFDLNIAANARTGTARFNLPIGDDDQIETTETVVVSGASPGFNVSSAVISITNNDTDPPTTVALSVSPTSVSEGAGSPMIEVTAAFPGDKSTLAADTEVTVSVGKTGDSAASGTDYTAVSDFKVTIDAGARTGNHSFTLPVTDDSRDESAEKITVSGEATGFTVSDAEITIADNEGTLDPIDCSEGTTTYVIDHETNTDLVADCQALVAARNYWVTHPANADLSDDHPLLTWGVGTSRRITEWEGVTVLSNRVVKLEMVTGYRRGISRDQYLPGWGLGGALPSQLGSLTGLSRLLLSNNDFTGPIPAELGNLINLRYLYLNGNRLSGAIPAELGRLSTNLRGLYLQENQLSGSIPADLGNLRGLQRLYLNDNRFTGALPARLGDLAPPTGSLTVLHINYPGLEGPIPTFLLGIPWIDLFAYDDPLGLVALGDFNRQASSGTHRWEIWRCDVGAVWPSTKARSPGC